MPARRVLFVCTGNICRSPLGEALFAHFVRERGLQDRFVADSAGLGPWHVGDRADPRTRRHAEKFGVAVTSIARQFEDDDFDRFDLILAMDRGHLRELRGRAGASQASRVRLMREYDQPPRQDDVPDPYYGGPRDFEEVFRILEVCCRNLLDRLLEAEAPAAQRP
ncbi:MAG: low molecular weight protein-tyrosine-phosphatase [Vicinamibacteria bacterium]